MTRERKMENSMLIRNPKKVLLLGFFLHLPPGCDVIQKEREKKRKKSTRKM
jgi:hypothetical protein